jgi:hypothetical protein
MAEAILHVHPTHQSARLGFQKHFGDALGNINVSPGASCRGVRASMLYIYGDREDWEEERLQEWLQTIVMACLVDDNPVRVVWGATHA